MGKGTKKNKNKEETTEIPNTAPVIPVQPTEASIAATTSSSGSKPEVYDEQEERAAVKFTAPINSFKETEEADIQSLNSQLSNASIQDNKKGTLNTLTTKEELEEYIENMVNSNTEAVQYNGEPFTSIADKDNMINAIIWARRRALEIEKEVEKSNQQMLQIGDSEIFKKYVGEDKTILIMVKAIEIDISRTKVILAELNDALACLDYTNRNVLVEYFELLNETVDVLQNIINSTIANSPNIIIHNDSEVPAHKLSYFVNAIPFSTDDKKKKLLLEMLKLGDTPEFQMFAVSNGYEDIFAETVKKYYVMFPDKVKNSGGAGAGSTQGKDKKDSKKDGKKDKYKDDKDEERRKRRSRSKSTSRSSSSRSRTPSSRSSSSSSSSSGRKTPIRNHANHSVNATVKCGCKSGCSEHSNCGCRKNRVTCTAYCGCNSHDNCSNVTDNEKSSETGSSDTSSGTD